MLKIPQINVPEGQLFYLSSGAWTNLTGLLLFATTHPVNSSAQTKTCREAGSEFTQAFAMDVIRLHPFVYLLPGSLV